MLKIVWKNGVAHLCGTVRKPGAKRGIRVRESCKTADPARAEEIRVRREAQLWERTVRGERGTHSFAEAVVLYLSQRSPGPSFRATLNRLLGWFKNHDVATIDQAAVDRYIVMKHANSHPATVIRAVITPLTAVLRAAAKRRWCDPPEFERPALPTRTFRFLTREEADRLLAHSAPHLKPLFAFLLHTGARLGEALRLQWSEVDLNRRAVRFVDTKNGESRGVPLNDVAFLALANLAHREGFVFRPPGRETGYWDGMGMGGSPVKTGWRGACKRAGIEGARVHDFRHTFCSWLAMGGASMLTIAELAGHKDLKVTRRYAHLSPEHLRGAVDMLSSAMLPDDHRKKESWQKSQR